MDILKKINSNHIFIRYFSLVFAEFVSAICFNLLLKPVNIVAGGTSGLSLIIEESFHIDTDIFIAIIYVITFIISLLLLGKESIIGLLVASICYPLFVTLTSNITDIIVISHTDVLLIAIFGGILSGISGGLIYKNGFPSSGVGVIAPILNKYFKISISGANFVINTVIVLFGGYYFGIDMILYAVILLYISKMVTNAIILGISTQKAILFRSTKIDLINSYIKDNYMVEPIIIKSDGFFKGQNGTCELVTIPTYRYHLLKNSLKKIDRNIFFVTSDCYELQEHSD